VRFLIAGLLMLALCPLVGARMPARGEWRHLAVLAFFYLIVGNGALCWASQHVKGGIASIVSPLSPLVVATVMAILPRGERLRPLGWFGLVAGFGGVVVLVWDKLTESTVVASMGELMLFVACLGWSAGTIYARFYSQRFHPLTLTTFQMLIGSAGLLGMAALHGPFLRAAASAWTWGAFAYMILVGGCLAFVAFTYLIQKMPATRAATYGYVNPAVALAMGAWLLDETYALHQLAGSAVIVAAVFLVHFSKVREGGTMSPS
jgi:drug/metabolite transporter (DMT)-like permease